MPMTVGADGTITVPVDADADPAAEEIATKIGKAFQQALKDPKVAAAFNTIIAQVVKNFKNISKASDKEFRTMQRQGERAARNIAKAFQEVGKAANAAMKTPTTNPSLRTLEASIAAIVDNFEELHAATREQVRLLELLTRGEQAATRARSQENRDRVLASTQATRREIAASQERANAARNAALVQSATIRATSREAIQQSRVMLRVFELTWKSAERFVRAFARGASAVLQGFGRTVRSIFQGIGRTITASVRAMNNVWRGFGRAGISALQGLSRAIASALRRDETATRTSLRRREQAFSQSLGRQAAAQARFQNASRTGLLGGLAGGGLLAGAAGGAGILGLLTSGFERASQEESLQLQFTTLLQDGDKATAMLKQISDFARTTRFDFVEVAGSVAQLTAAFEDADRAYETVTFLSDVISLTGGGTQQFGAARLALAQIAASGRLEGDELRQILEAAPGVPLARILADRFFGGDQAAFQEARRNGELGGKITADAFFDAFEDGAREAFPELEGFSQRVGQSLGGLADNLRENFAIFGAQIIRLVEGPLKTAMNSINEFLRAAGGFISGEMFGPAAGDNPFRGQGVDARNRVNFEDLPEEMQNVLRTELGWEAGQGFFLSAADAEAMWDNLNPPSEIVTTLQKIRDLLGDIAKGVASVLGVAGAFKILRLAFIALTSPLALLVLFSSAISAAFSLMYENSEPLREALSGLRESFGELGSTISGFISRVGENISNRLFGSPDLWANLGDQVAKVVDFLDRGVQSLNNFLTGDLQAGSLLDNIHDAIFGEDDESAIAGFEEQMFGTTSDQRGIATRILDALENTFLGPIIRFFRGPFADLVERIGGGVADFGGFLGNMFNAIFGDDPGGVGTRILDVLNDTFLGPVIRFFRGPFANGVEGLAGTLDGIWDTAFGWGTDAVSWVQERFQPVLDAISNFFSTAQTEGVGAAFGDIGSAIASVFSGLWSGGSKGKGGGGIKGALKGLWDDITGWFADTFTAKNILSVASVALAGIEETGRQIGRIIGDPLFIGIVAGATLAIIAAVALILFNFASGLISGVAENAGEWGEIIGNGFTIAMEWITTEGPGVIADAIGGMINNPEVGLALVGAGLLLGTGVGKTLALGAFTFFRNRTETGKMRKAIADGMQNANLGSAVTTGLNQAPTPPTPVTFLSKIRTSITNGINRAKETFKSIGRNIGIAIMGGLAAFEFGNIAGRRGGTGSFLLALLGGAGSGGAAGAFIGGGPGAIIGAGIGAALAGIGAVFGANAQQAEDARAEVELYADALRELSGIEVTKGIEDLIRQTLVDAGTDAFDEWGDALVNMSEFDLSAFAQRLQDGISTPAQEATIYLQGLVDEAQALDSAGLTGAQFENFIALVDELGLTLEQVASLSGQDIIDLGMDQSQIDLVERGRDILADLGITEDDLGSTHELLAGRSQVVADALAKVALEAELGVGPAGDLKDATDDIFDTTKDPEKLAGMIEDIGAVMTDTAKAAEDAKVAVEDFFDIGTYRGSFQAWQDEFRANVIPDLDEDFADAFDIDLSDVGDSAQDEISAVFAGLAPDDAAFNIFAGNFTDNILDGIQTGMDSGTIATGLDLFNFINDINAAIRESDLPVEVQDALIAAVDEATGGLGGLLDTQAQTAATAVNKAFADADILANLNDILQAEDKGKAVAEGVAQGIAGSASEVSSAIDDMMDTALGGGVGSKAKGGRGDANTLGRKVSTDIGRGISSAAGAVTGAVRIIGIATTLVFIQAASGAYAAGTNIANAFARGVRDAGRQAVAAAAAMAASVVAITRSILSIASPSKVFIDIGKQVGEGFIEGIKESEGDMAAAMGSALEGAIDEAVRRAGVAVQRAEAAGKLFELLAPSILPGGATNVSILQDLLNQRMAAGSPFGAGLRSGAADALGNSGRLAITGAAANVVALGRQIAAQVIDMRGAFGDAKAAQADINKYAATLAGINRDFKSGALGQREYAARLRDMREQVAVGSMTWESFNDQVKVLNKQLSLGILNRDARTAALSELGQKPGALTYQQQQLIQFGPATLDPRNAQGLQNREMVVSSLETIRAWGQEALNAGQSLNTVIPAMQKYRDSLANQLRSLGFNIININSLVDAAGLSNAALTTLRNNLTSLSQTSAAGIVNVQNFLEQFVAIREFGQRMLESGVPLATVTAQMRSFRDSIVSQAVAFGFSRTQIDALVATVGLSNTSLADFIAQLAAFDKAAKDAAATADAAAKEAAKREADEKRRQDEEAAGLGQTRGIRPRIEQLHIHVPTGDPEAIALLAGNRLAYEDLTSWS